MFPSGVGELHQAVAVDKRVKGKLDNFGRVCQAEGDPKEKRMEFKILVQMEAVGHHPMVKLLSGQSDISYNFFFVQRREGILGQIRINVWKWW